MNQMAGKIRDFKSTGKWDILALRDLGIVPDQAFAESSFNRMDGIPAIGFSVPGYTPKCHEDQIACDTDLYYYKNQTVGKNDQTTLRPSGFFLFTFMDGHTVKVKPEDVRLLNGIRICPGMKEYRTDLPLLPELQANKKSTP